MPVIWADATKSSMAEENNLYLKSDMNKILFWQRWLLCVGVLIIAFGVMMAFFSKTVLFGIFDARINVAFWGTENVTVQIKNFQQWIYGVLGTVMAGWGVVLLFMVRNPFRKRERWAWVCLFTGLMVWYVPDTLISLYFRVYINAVLNSVLFVLAVIPLVFTRKYFLGGRRR